MDNIHIIEAIQFTSLFDSPVDVVTFVILYTRYIVHRPVHLENIINFATSLMSTFHYSLIYTPI